MPTTLDLITEALTDLGVLADGESPSASQAQGALSKLNSMLDTWNAENLMVYGSVGNVFPLVPGQSTYTIGTGGNFNIPRPAKITAVYLRTTAGPVSDRLDLPLWNLTNDEWEQWSLKGMTGSLPQAVWINTGMPLDQITFVPVPSDSTYSAVVWTDGMLGNLTLYQNVLVPPGYYETIVANLVIRLAPSYQPLQVTDITAQIASSGKKTIRANNLQVNILRIDPRLSGMPYPRSTFYSAGW